MECRPAGRCRVDEDFSRQTRRFSREAALFAVDGPHLDKIIRRTAHQLMPYHSKHISSEVGREIFAAHLLYFVSCDIVDNRT